jgi:predicted Zn-dependent protease
MNNEAELAMVMGHEIGHVTARHGVKQYSRAQIAGLGLGLGSIFVPQVARFGQIAQSALQLVFLKYGRDDETQADELGVEYSLKGGFDATVGTRFFEVLDRMSQESGQSLPTWLSTHPAPADRVKRTHDLALAEKPKINANASTVAEAPHKQRVDGAVFGDDPRQGFTRGSTFLHPSLRFQMTFPRGWQIQNTPSAVLSGEPNQRAVMQMTLEKSEGLTPRRYAERVVQSAQASVVSGGAERIHGFDAYILELSIQSQDGAVPVFAAFVQREAGGPIFQIVGQTASGAFRTYFDDFLQSTRSLQTLTDSEALNMQPNRVKVEKIASSTTLEAAARRVATPVPISTIALLNNLQPNSTLPAGFLVKLVRGNYRPEERTGSGN